jgi:hypothetical protein
MGPEFLAAYSRGVCDVTQRALLTYICGLRQGLWMTKCVG